VAIDYRRFLPTGRAILTLVTPDVLNKNLHALKNTTISSIPITAVSCPAPSDIARIRGVDGRKEAAERGRLTGDGPGGGITNGGKNVVIWGLPGRVTPEGLKNLLRDFKLAGTEGKNQEFYKLNM